MSRHAPVEEQVAHYIASSFLSEEQAANFGRETDLLTILDSLQLLRTVVQIEALFDLAVAENEVTVENLGSVARIAAFVERKRQAGGPAPACSTGPEAVQ
jgi:acyl carrier protein